MDGGHADEYQNNGHVYRSPNIARALRSAQRAIRAADSDYGRMLAVRDGRAELERLGDDRSDAIGELSNFAISVGLNPDDVQTALDHGLDLFLSEPASGAPKSPLEVIQGELDRHNARYAQSRPTKLTGKAPPDFYNRNAGAADVALEPNASQAVLRFDEWLKRDPNLPKANLVIDSSDPTAAAKALSHLIAARDNFLFNGYAPIYVAAEAENMPKATVVKTETVRILAHEICVPVKAGKDGKFIPIALSEDIAGLYLRGLEGFWGLKPFNGITAAPILSDDGSIRAAEGYDQISGMWCHNIPVVSVPEHPTKDEADAALGYIRHTFRTFPFTDGTRVRDAE